MIVATVRKVSTCAILCVALMTPATIANRQASACCSQTFHKCEMSSHAPTDGAPGVFVSHQILPIPFRVEPLLVRRASSFDDATHGTIRCDDDVGSFVMRI